MTNDHSTCLWLVQEPTHTYHTDNPPLTSKRATVLTAGYPPLKSNNGAGTWRKIPWINLRGFWLEQAGFQIGTPYTIQTYDGKLVFTVEK